MRLGVSIVFDKAEINYVGQVTTLANAYEKIVGLDIMVDEGFGVNVLDPGDKLIG